MENANLHKRISIFVPSFAGGGAEKAMLLFAGAAAAKGHHVDFLAGSGKGPLRSSLPAGVGLRDFRCRRTAYCLPHLIAYLRKERPHALYSTIFHANVLAVTAARLAGCGTRVVLRESNVPRTSRTPTLSAWTASRLVPRLYPSAHAVISVSAAVADELIALNPKLKSKVIVSPNPVISRELFRLAEQEPHHPWALTEETPFVVAAGRLHPQKDFATLLRAFQLVSMRRRTRLIILGEGGERARLEALAAELGLTDVVSLPGFVDNPFPFLKRAASFVLSSQYEGMPNVLIQAMAFGTPIVATDCPGGHPELLKASGGGQLVPVADHERLADAITTSIDLPRSRSAAAFAEQQFGVEQAAQHYLDVLDV